MARGISHLLVTCLLAFLPSAFAAQKLPPETAPAQSNEKPPSERCAKLAIQHIELMSRADEVRRMQYLKEMDAIHLEEIVSFHAGQTNENSATMLAQNAQKRLEYQQAQVQLLERVRLSLAKSSSADSGSMSGPAPATTQVLGSLLDKDAKELAEEKSYTLKNLREHQTTLSGIKSADPEKAKQELSQVTQEKNSLADESKKLNTQLLEMRQQIENEKCGKQPGSTRAYVLKAKDANKQKACARLREQAEPAHKKYTESRDIENAFVMNSLLKAKTIENAHKDEKLFPRAENALTEQRLRLMIMKEKASILELARDYPEKYKDLAILLKEPFVTLIDETEEIKLAEALYIQDLEEYARVRQGVDQFKKRTNDDQREFMAQLEGRKTTLANAREAAFNEYQKALEPFYQANCSTYSSLLPLIGESMLALGPYLGYGMGGGYGGGSAYGLGVGFGAGSGVGSGLFMQAPNLGAPRGKAPGNYR